jgi:hypothetical protein
MPGQPAEGRAPRHVTFERLGARVHVVLLHLVLLGHRDGRVSWPASSFLGHRGDRAGTKVHLVRAWSHALRRLSVSHSHGRREGPSSPPRKPDASAYKSPCLLTRSVSLSMARRNFGDKSGRESERARRGSLSRRRRPRGHPPGRHSPGSIAVAPRIAYTTVAPRPLRRSRWATRRGSCAR